MVWNAAPIKSEFDDRIRSLLEPGDGGPPLTHEAVGDAERRLGVRLPADLLSLLGIQNGGYVRREFEACPTARPTSWADDHVPVREIAGIGSAGGVVSLLDSPYLNREWGQPPELILLSGDGHWRIALDYRDCGPAGEPPVVFYENECDPHDVLRLARSFRQFVCMLSPEPADDASL